jgi:hypothetical protein
MGFGGLESNEKKLQFDLTESARTVCLGFSFVLLLTLTVDVAVSSGKMNNADLDGLFIVRVHANGRTT